MSEPRDHTPSPGEPAGEPRVGDAEESDALPVLAERRQALNGAHATRELADARRQPAMLPAVQAAAAAAGGFVAGAAVVSLVQRRRRRSAAPAKGRRAGRALGRGGRRARSSAAAGELVQIVGSRSLLVDVHLLGGSGRNG